MSYNSTHQSSLKTRHYAQLASRLNELQQNLAETEVNMRDMSLHLGLMAQLGGWTASQFMANSRLVDLHVYDILEEDNRKAEEAARNGAASGGGSS